MRIAIANTARNYGGQEAMAAVLAEQLQARGHDVVFLCRPVYPALERLRSRVPVEPVLGGTDWDPRSIWRARRVLQRHGAQVMLVTTNKDMRSAALAAWSLGVPVVVRRGMGRALPDTPHYRLLYGRLPAHIVINSEGARRTLLDSAPWLDPDRVSVIHNGIDAAPYRQAEAVDLGTPPAAFTLGFIGRLVQWKGVEELAQAWPRVEREVPNAWLVVVGEGEMEEEMRQRLRGSARVRWFAFRRDIPSVLKSLELLVLPSHPGGGESLPNVILEAMAAGKTVVSTPVAGIPELVEDRETGVLVPPRDPDALAETLIALARDPARCRRMGEAGARVVRERFSREAMIDRFETLLTRVVDGGR